MPLARLTLSDAPAARSDVELLVVGALKTDDGPELLAPDGFEWLVPLLGGLGVSGATDELVRVPGPAGGPTVVGVIGLGRRADADTLRYAAGSAARQLAGLPRAAFAIPTEDPAAVSALLEGAALGAYAFNDYRSSGAKPALAEIVVHTPFDEGVVGLDRASVVASAVALAKDLVNTPPADLSPVDLAERSLVEVAELPVATRVWDVEGLAADGFGGILGVGQGSTRPPRLVRLDFAPDGATGHLALVGKGITFDSGGLSLKPAASMVGMKSDMAGAAAVLAAVAAVARLGTPIRVTGWLCLAENLPSGSATRPNDVLHIRGGKTVEVLNTDAEGRLVLADGIVAASEESPDAIIDIATLTGAQLVALGTRTSAIMGDPELADQLLAAAEDAGEAFWPMPLPGELRPLLNSEVADLANAKIGNTAGGMLLAGVFLREFVGRRDDGEPIPWAHLDIAGPAWNTGGAWGHTGTGGTGVAVRTLVRLAERLAAGTSAAE